MYSMVLLSGGAGNRMRQTMPKQYLQLAGRPVITHIMERIEPIEQIQEVIVVCDPAYNALIESYLVNMNFQKKYRLVKNGVTRQESVYNGLIHAENDRVLVHEAARPFVSCEDFQMLIDENEENCTFGRPLPFTVLRMKDNYISGILDRSELINIQLPQKFRKETLLTAHQNAIREGKTFTEDASMLLTYQLGKVKIIPGKEYNMKLTEPLDMLIGEQIYKTYFANRR